MSLTQAEVAFVRDLMNCGLDCKKVSLLGAINEWSRFRVTVAVFSLVIIGTLLLISGWNSRQDPEKNSTWLIVMGIIMILFGVWVWRNRDSNFVKAVFFAGD